MISNIRYGVVKMHEIDSVIELAGLIVSASGCSCLIILFAQWLNGVYVSHMQKRYILALRMKYELSRKESING
jgi:hypothetical protein